MKRIFITGMSGTGKSYAIEALRARGFTAIDTDYGGWCEFAELDGEAEWIWCEERMLELLNESSDRPLFVSGCVSNQGKFYGFFDYKVLFSAPLEVMLERVAARSTNPYGKSQEERAQIRANFAEVQPLLQQSADLEMDTSVMSVGEIVDYLVALTVNDGLD